MDRLRLGTEPSDSDPSVNNLGDCSVLHQHHVLPRAVRTSDRSPLLHAPAWPRANHRYRCPNPLEISYMPVLWSSDNKTDRRIGGGRCGVAGSKASTITLYAGCQLKRGVCLRVLIADTATGISCGLARSALSAAVDSHQ